jgi:hypothetical protein
MHSIYLHIRSRKLIEPWTKELVLVPQGKNCKFGRDYFVFYPCLPGERYNADPCKLTFLSLEDEYCMTKSLNPTAQKLGDIKWYLHGTSQRSI